MGVITFSQQYGCDATQIGQRVANLLDYRLLDRDIPIQIARKTDMPISDVMRWDERADHALVYGLKKLLFSTYPGAPNGMIDDGAWLSQHSALPIREAAFSQAPHGVKCIGTGQERNPLRRRKTRRRTHGANHHRQSRQPASGIAMDPGGWHLRYTMTRRKKHKQKSSDLAGSILVFATLLGLLVLGYWSLSTDQGGRFPGLERGFGAAEMTRQIRV